MNESGLLELQIETFKNEKGENLYDKLRKMGEKVMKKYISCSLVLTTLLYSCKTYI